MKWKSKLQLNFSAFPAKFQQISTYSAQSLNNINAFRTLYCAETAMKPEWTFDLHFDFEALS